MQTVQNYQADIDRCRASIRERMTNEPERIGSPSIGDVVRQGDLYLVCVELGVSGGSLSETTQLAPGTTHGSRHVADGDCVIITGHKNKVKIGETEINSALIGPYILCRGETTITHPDHGHKILPADTAWIVVYQRMMANEIRRVMD